MKYISKMGNRCKIIKIEGTSKQRLVTAKTDTGVIFQSLENNFKQDWQKI